MTKEIILEKIIDSMNHFDIEDLNTQLDEFLKISDDEEVSKELSALLFKRYTTFKAEGLAKFMEIFIRKKTELALLRFPENYFFRLAVLRGSMELYECYMEEAIEPYLKDKSEDDTFDFYIELQSIAEQLTEAFFGKYVKCIKGLDFNGAFGRYPENENLVLINKEDYEILDDAVEKYNTIIGRRDILADLDKRINDA